MSNVCEKDAPGDLVTYKPLKEQKNGELPEVETLRMEVRIPEGFLWKDLFNLSKRLGVKIERLSMDAGTLEGPRGPVEMFTSIISRDEIESKMKIQGKDGKEDESTHEEDFRTTSAHIATLCNAPNK